MNYVDSQSVRTHDLLEIDAKRFLSCHTCTPEWVVENLHRTPFVVVRRGLATWPVIPVGVRGVDRNQRWAATCAFNLVKSILAPPQLLRRSVPKSRENAIPAFRALNLMKERWRDLDYPWGPGGSIGFELAAGTNIAKPESDLDLVIYAAGRITGEMAQISLRPNAGSHCCCRRSRGGAFMRLFSQGIRVAKSRQDFIANAERNDARNGPVG